MQKIVNVLAVASSLVSLAVIGGGLYLFVQKDAIIESVTEKAMDSVLGDLSPGGALGGVGGSIPNGDLPLGTNDLAPTTPQASLPDMASPQPF